MPPTHLLPVRGLRAPSRRQGPHEGNHSKARWAAFYVEREREFRVLFSTRAAQIEFFYSTLFWTPFSGERPAYKIWGTRAVDNRRHRVAAKASIAECVAHPVKLKRIVALGDGMFSSGFPKKTFARELSMRGPTLIISEFCTSKMYPCGTCELEDVPNAGRPQPLDARRRPRRHIGHRGSINLCCAIEPFAKLRQETDRNELACMNILRCMASGFAPRLSRPSHLRTPAGWQRTDALMDT